MLFRQKAPENLCAGGVGVGVVGGGGGLVGGTIYCRRATAQ